MSFVGMKLIGFIALLGMSCVMAKDEEPKKEKETVGTVIGIDLGTTYSWYAKQYYIFTSSRDEHL